MVVNAPKIQNNGRDSSEISPVFIVSSGRAGTTLLRAMLNAQPNFHCPHESDFIARAFPFYYGANQIPPTEYERLIQFFRQTSQNRGWGMPESFLLSYLKQIRPNRFSETVTAFARAYIEYHSLPAKRWGIKAPVLIASLPRILAVFPFARVIHMVRDGRDVYLSYLAIRLAQAGKSFGPGNVVTAALYWVDGLRRIKESACEIHEVRYEDLLVDPKVTLESVCEFVDIECIPQMYENYFAASGNRNSILPKHKKTIHAKVGSGLDVDNVEKYSRMMSGYQLFLFELVAAPYLLKYQYRLTYKWLGYGIFGILRAPFFWLARLFNNFRYARRDKRVQKIVFES